MKIKLLPFLLFFAFSSPAQRLEHFDVLLFSLTKAADGSWQPGAPRFLTAYNPRGYNNQPAFFPGGEIYLTVQAPTDTTQTEIYALDPIVGVRTRVTATPESEFSPTPMPGSRQFSAVRVESDGRQRLWAFPLDRSDFGRPIFPAIGNVGYHCWLRDTLAALFLVGAEGQPDLLVLAGTRGQKPLRIATKIGRCLQKMPDGRLAFVQKATEQTWFVKTYDLRTQTSEILVKTPPNSEDFVVLPDGTLLAGSGPKLYEYKPGLSADWKEIANLSKYGVKNITRLACQDNKLAMVVEGGIEKLRN